MGEAVGSVVVVSPVVGPVVVGSVPLLVGPSEPVASVTDVVIASVVPVEVGAPLLVADPSMPPVSSPSPAALNEHPHTRAQARKPPWRREE